MRINHLPLIRIINNHLIYYPTPTNFTYINSFGVIAGIFLSIQILTGIFLAMHYTPEVTLAFTSIDHIMRDTNHGWLLRYTHANGASLFFIAVFIHIVRGLYYNSFLMDSKKVVVRRTKDRGRGVFARTAIDPIAKLLLGCADLSQKCDRIERPILFAQSLLHRR